MPRRRIGDGTSPYLLGQIVIDLAERERGYEVDVPPSNGRDDAVPLRTATNLAARVGLSPTQARVAANELVRARCLRLRRTTTSRTETSGRYSQGFFLPEPAEERGPGRNPRLRPVALLIESNRAIMDAMGRVLRELGALPVGVSSLRQARGVLEHLAFELVVVGDLDDASGSESTSGAGSIGAAEAVGRAAWAARCGPVIERGGVEISNGGSRQSGIGPLGLAGFRVAAATALGIPTGAPAPRARPRVAPRDDLLAHVFE